MGLKRYTYCSTGYVNDAKYNHTFWFIRFLFIFPHRVSSKIANKVFSTTSLDLSSRRSGEAGDTVAAQYMIWCVVDHIGGNLAGGHYIVHIKTCAFLSCGFVLFCLLTFVGTWLLFRVCC
jgi:hypothetical protein